MPQPTDAAAPDRGVAAWPFPTARPSRPSTASATPPPVWPGPRGFAASGRIGLIAALAFLLGGPADAEGLQPRAAIDWLNKPSPGADAVPGAPGPGGEVEVIAIGAAALDSAGAFSEDESGVPLDFWGDLSSLRARALLGKPRGTGTLAAENLYRRILLARARAPRATGPGGAFLRLRVERLLHIGALADARDLLAASGARGPAFTEYALTIGQLTAEDIAPCTEALEADDPLLAVEFRIYCQIRLGREDAARAGIAAARGASDPAILELLEAQIDPGLARIVAGPEDVAALSPLGLALIDGVGAPRPANFASAPAAYSWADLTEAAPPRDRMIAAEKLVRVGAIPAGRLIRLYAAQRSAESGGVWGRVEAWRRLEAAAPADLAARLVEMDRRAAEAGLRAALAPALNVIASKADTADAPALRRFAEIALIAGDLPAALARLDGGAPELLRAAAALLAGQAVEVPETAAKARRGDLEAQRVMAALTALGGASARRTGTDEAVSLAPDAPAAAVLEALALLDAGGEIAPAALHAALGALAAAGFAADARAIAVETLLGGRGA